MLEEMMAGNPYLLAGGLAGKFLGNFISTRSERNRLKKLQFEQFSALAPMEALLRQQDFGASETDSRLSQSVTTRTLTDLANRGVLNSSISAPAVASAVAPIEEQRQARRQSLMERLTAAKMAIYQNTSMPGYGNAFGQSLGEAGDVMAYMYGRGVGGRAGENNPSVGYQQGSNMTPPEQQLQPPRRQPAAPY